MNIKLHFLILSSAVLTLCPLLASCDDEFDDKNAPVFITTDIMGITNVNSNTYKRIKIEVHSSNVELEQLRISSYDDIRGNVGLLDSAVSGRSLYHEYLYKVPMLSHDSVMVNLKIEVSDRNGFAQTLSRRLLVIARDYKLEEVSGITLYTNEIKDHPNGYCLEDMRPLVVSMADSAAIDIYTYVDENASETLTREWCSNTDIYFARANQFDYANATNRSVVEAFGSAVANPRISRIERDDIILVGRGNKAVGVIKVVQFYDEPGVENDRYLINIKKITQ